MIWALREKRLNISYNLRLIISKNEKLQYLGLKEQILILNCLRIIKNGIINKCPNLRIHLSYT